MHWGLSEYSLDDTIGHQIRKPIKSVGYRKDSQWNHQKAIWKTAISILVNKTDRGRWCQTTVIAKTDGQFVFKQYEVAKFSCVGESFGLVSKFVF